MTRILPRSRLGALCVAAAVLAAATGGYGYSQYDDLRRGLASVQPRVQGESAPRVPADALAALARDNAAADRFVTAGLTRWDAPAALPPAATAPPDRRTAALSDGDAGFDISATPTIGQTSDPAPDAAIAVASAGPGLDSEVVFGPPVPRPHRPAAALRPALAPAPGAAPRPAARIQPSGNRIAQRAPLDATDKPARRLVRMPWVIGAYN